LRGEEGKRVEKTLGVQAPQAKRRDVQDTLVRVLALVVARFELGIGDLLCVSELSLSLMVREVIVLLLSVVRDRGVAG
jgi:hypothetical protein